MRAYILAIAGVVLISAVVAIICPNGKMGNFVKGATKLFILVVLVTPFVSFLKGNDFPFVSAEFTVDEGYMNSSAAMIAECDRAEIEAFLLEEYGIGAFVEVTRSAKDFSLEKICVKIYDFGIIGQDRHIDITADVKTALEKRYGCSAEVM